MKFFGWVLVVTLSCLWAGNVACAVPIGDWDDIREQFEKWEISKFKYGGGIADGGSVGFCFKTANDVKFDLVVVNRGRWTKEDLEEGIQPVFLYYQNRWYPILHKSDIEEKWLNKLGRAVDRINGEGWTHPKYIRRLCEILKSREPFEKFQPLEPPFDWPYKWRYEWPHDPLEFSPEYGDWVTIRKQFSKWEITKFNEWGWAGIPSFGSKVFRFMTSDGTGFGVLAPVYKDPITRMKIEAGAIAVEEKSEPAKVTDSFVTEESLAEPQSFYLHSNNQLCLIEPGSEFEKMLIGMLDQAAVNLKGDYAAHPKYIERLREAISSREGLHQAGIDWPMTYREVDAQRKLFESKHEPQQ